jgi:thiamine monophosphate synthase
MELIINTKEGISKILISSKTREEKMNAIKRRILLFSHIVEKFLVIPAGTIGGFNIAHVEELLEATQCDNCRG